MTTVGDDGLAVKRLTYLEEVLLTFVVESAEPCGARQARRHADAQGIAVSEATVSRALSKLDQRGLTEPVARKGRIATRAGRLRAEELTESRGRNEVLARAKDVRSLAEMLDVLRARRAVECEAARAAAERGSFESLATLQALLDCHRSQADESALLSCTTDFHHEVARLSGNSVLIAVGDMLFGDRFAALYSLMDNVIATADDRQEALAAHEAIFYAIHDGRPDDASEAMYTHLTRFIDHVAGFAASDQVGLVDALLLHAQPKS